MANPCEEFFSLVSSRYKKVRLEYMLADQMFDVIGQTKLILNSIEKEKVMRIVESGSSFY